MTEGKIARLDVCLYYECPNCEEVLNLISERDCSETGTTDDYPSEAWMAVLEWMRNEEPRQLKGTCGACQHPIEIDNIEY